MSLAATPGALIQFPFAELSAGEFNCCCELGYPESRVVIMSQKRSPIHRSEDLYCGPLSLRLPFHYKNQSGLKMHCPTVRLYGTTLFTVLKVKLQYLDR